MQEAAIFGSSTYTQGAVRIDIYGQGGNGCGASSSLTMQETMPAPLHGHMSPQDWQLFQEEMKAVLDPLSNVKKKQAVANMIFFCVFLVCFVGFAISGFSNVSSFAGSGISPFYFWICIPICMLGFVAFQFYMRALAAAATDQIRAVVSTVSARHSTLTFHVRADMFAAFHRHRRARAQQIYYIEVSISGGFGVGGTFASHVVSGMPIAADMPPMVVPAVAVDGSAPLVATAVAGDLVTGAAVINASAVGFAPMSTEALEQSLQQIEVLHAAGLLTKAEYDAKRAEILARI